MKFNFFTLMDKLSTLEQYFVLYLLFLVDMPDAELCALHLMYAWRVFNELPENEKTQRRSATKQFILFEVRCCKLQASLSQVDGTWEDILPELSHLKEDGITFKLNDINIFLSEEHSNQLIKDVREVLSRTDDDFKRISGKTIEQNLSYIEREHFDYYHNNQKELF